MKQAFVTGGTGFLGCHVVEQLCQESWQVHALHRPTSNLDRLASYDVKPAVGDLLDPPSLARAIPVDVDVVFHVAANTSIWSRNNQQQFQDNVIGTRNLVAAALAAGAKRFVHTSTWNTYGWWQAEISEDSPQLGGESWVNYDQTKFKAEQEVRLGIERGLEAVILNPAHIIGRYDRHNWARMIRMVDDSSLPGVPGGAGSFCHAQAVAAAHLAAAELGRSGENYLLGGTDATFLEVVQTIGRMLDRRVPRSTMPTWLLRLVARLKVTLAAFTGREPDLTPEGVALITSHPRIVSQKAEQELGYTKVPIETMLEDSISWLGAQGFITSK